MGYFFEKSPIVLHLRFLLCLTKLLRNDYTKRNYWIYLHVSFPDAYMHAFK